MRRPWPALGRSATTNTKKQQQQQQQQQQHNNVVQNEVMRQLIKGLAEFDEICQW